MDSQSDSQTSPALLLLLDRISAFVRLFLKEGEQVLITCESQPAFQAIRSVLEQLSIEDIGITAKTIGYFFQPGKICGIKVLEEANASISVFCLSKDMTLSFHDHPHMSVLSKVLFGELERITVDLSPEEDKKKPKGKKTHGLKNSNTSPESLPGKRIVAGTIVHKDIVRSPSIMRLTPNIENVHSLRAKKDCILFDVLIPNYDNAYRQCRFYRMLKTLMEPSLPLHKKVKNEVPPKDPENVKGGDLPGKFEDDKTTSTTDKSKEALEETNGLKEGRILLEEIEEPDEIASFVVVAFPKLLTLKL